MAATSAHDPARSAWDPEQYRRFSDERAQPFHDLLDRLSAAPVGRAVDLGCGPGELTALAARRLDAGEMVGIDNSPTMLASASAHASGNVRFEFGDIATWTSDGDHDLVLAAASLQWVPDHPTVLERWTRALAPGGRLAVQVPANAHAPTHVVAGRLAATEPYLSAFGADGPPPDPVRDNVLAPDGYARILFGLGYVDIDVRLQVYPHVLPSTRHAVEWVRGTTLTRFRSVLSDDVFDAFLADYERLLLDVMGDDEPCFFPFNRILFTARRP
jgi:trans-aconitate 2-methyltransferase